jgi:hypothetical protein
MDGRTRSAPPAPAPDPICGSDLGRDHRVWLIEGRTFEGYGFHVPELQTDVYGLLDARVGERIELVIAPIKHGRWIGYCPGLPGVIVDADTIDELRREISRFVAMIPIQQLGQDWPNKVITEQGELVPN